MRRNERINEMVKKIEDFFSKEKRIAAVFLFGSFGTEFENSFSDIDIGIIFMPDIQVGLEDELDLDARLSLFLKTDQIDLVNLNKAPIQLRFNAIKDGDLIYERDNTVTSDFIENTYRYYLDYSYHLKKLKRERAKVLKGVYLDGK